MTGPRPAGRPWTITDDEMLRKLLTSGIHRWLIAQKMKPPSERSNREFLFLKSPVSGQHRKPELLSPRAAGSAVELKIRSHRSRESQLNACPTGGIMLRGLGKRRLIGGAVVSLVITMLLSLGVVYGLNRYLGPVEEPGWTTGSARR